MMSLLTNSHSAPLTLNYEMLVTSGNQQLSSLGLLDNMVYDVIPEVPSAVGQTVVNASIFNVQCESILPSTLDPPETRQFHPGDATSKSVFGDLGVIITPLPGTSVSTHFALLCCDTDTSAIPVYPSGRTGYVDNVTACTNHHEACWSPLIVSSTVPVVDASGTMGLESGSSTYWASVWPPILQNQPIDPTGLNDNNSWFFMPSIIVRCTNESFKAAV